MDKREFMYLLLYIGATSTGINEVLTEEQVDKIKPLAEKFLKYNSLHGEEREKVIKNFEIMFKEIMDEI